MSSVRGSSPLTRGKRSGDPASGSVTGLIPAHAGKTYRDPMGRRVYGAHPRSRGENRRRACELMDSWGSSPLTRGKRLVLRPRRLLDGLIPAHAGKT